MRDGGGLRLGGDILDHALKIAKHLLGGNANSADSSFGQPAITCFVVPDGEIMRLAINLDAELSLIAVEVQNERPGGMLLPEAQSELVLPKRSPKQPLGQRHRLAQLAGTPDGFLRSGKLQDPPPSA